MASAIQIQKAERLLKRRLCPGKKGWNELPRERVKCAYVAELPSLGVCVVEWRGQAPTYPRARVRACK